MAKQAGVDLNKAREALMGGFAGSKVMEIHALRIISDTYIPGFKAKLHHKDLQIAGNTIDTFGLDLPGSRLAIDYMEKLVEQGHEEIDSAGVAKIVQQLAKK